MRSEPTTAKRNYILIAVAAVMLVMLSAVHQTAAQQKDALARQASSANIDEIVPSECRTGVAVVPNYPETYNWLPTLEAGWFNNFSPYEYDEPNARFTFYVRTRQVFSGGVRQDAYTVFPAFGFEVGQLGWFLRRHPGGMWIIGNEMDVNNADQDNIMPALYAEAYHNVYHYIKGVDPMASVAVGPVSMITPGRLQYLDIVWNTYRQKYGTTLPFDAWTFNSHNLPERTRASFPQDADGKIALGTDPALALLSSSGDPALCPNPATPEIDPRPDVVCVSEHDSIALFRKQVQDMRAWMDDKTRARSYAGQRSAETEVFIADYGTRFAYSEEAERETGCGGRIDEFGNCFTPQRAANFLKETFRYLRTATGPGGFASDGGRLVQRWSWYPVYTEFRSGQVANLLRPDFRDFEPGDPAALSVVGQALLEVNAPVVERNLTGGKGTNLTAYVRGETATTTAPIRINYVNGGTRAIIDPFTITFYADAALTQAIGSVVVTPEQDGIVDGCNFQGESKEVRIDWPNLGVGVHPYWAKIDSSNAIAETNEADNVTTRGVITVYDAGIFTNSVFFPATRGGRGN